MAEQLIARTSVCFNDLKMLFFVNALNYIEKK